MPHVVHHHGTAGAGVLRIRAIHEVVHNQLFAAFKQATQSTPLEYLQKVKIEAARRKLENSSHSIQTLMYEVGYNDIKTFRDIFKRLTGVTPKDYRKKYGLNHAAGPSQNEVATRISG
jgi:AraC-like DNA-binding protein